MAIKNLKDKLKNLASGETLGETKGAVKGDSLDSVQLKRKSKPATKVNKKKSPIEEKTSDEQLIERRKKRAERAERHSLRNTTAVKPEALVEVEQTKKKPRARKSSEVNEVKEAVDGYKDILKMIGVKEKLDLDVEFNSADLDYVQFTQTTPWGFDYDEVTDFMSRAKYTVHKLETALAQRDRDIIIAASEVKKTELKMVEAKNQEEMSRMLGGQTEEERLIEENIDLKIKLTNLEKRLKEAAANKGSIEEMSREIEALRSENEYLVDSMSDTRKPAEQTGKRESAKLGLPRMDDLASDEDSGMPDVGDSFDDMLDGLGGLYDDE